MASTIFYGNLVNYNVMPTEHDHCGDGFGGDGAGRIPQELTFSPLLCRISGVTGMVESGLQIPTSGTLSGSVINANITAGKAIIEGYRIAGTYVINVDFVISSLNHVWLKLEKDAADRVLRPVIQIDDVTDSDVDFTVPDSALYLGNAVCDATSITSTVQAQFMNRIVMGQISRDVSHVCHIDDYGTSNFEVDWDKPADRAFVTYKIPFLRLPFIVYSYAAGTAARDQNALTGFRVTGLDNGAYYRWFEIG